MGKKISPKRGFTLIEMALVLGIIAVLTLLSVAGLLGGRANGISNAAAEDLVNQIRDAQNRATSIVKDSVHTTLPKGWGVKVTNSVFSLVSYTDGTNLTIQSPAEYGSPSNSAISGVTYDIVVKDGSGNVITGGPFNTLYVTYMAPFGTPYIYYTTSASDTCSDGSTRLSMCKWEQTTKSTNEWGPTVPSGNFISRSNHADYTTYITTTYQNTKNTIVINSSGDVYVQ